MNIPSTHVVIFTATAFSHINVSTFTTKTAHKTISFHALFFVTLNRVPSIRSRAAVLVAFSIPKVFLLGEVVQVTATHVVTTQKALKLSVEF